MESGKKSLNNPKVVVDHFSQGSKAVGCAGGIGHNLHARLVGILIDTHYEHGGIRGRST